MSYTLSGGKHFLRSHHISGDISPKEVRMRTRNFLIPLLFLSSLVMYQVCGPGARESSAAAGNGSSPQDIMVKVHDVNAVALAITNTGQIGNDIFTGNAAGIWPAWTSNNYVFGSGLWIGGLADVNGDGTQDTVVVYGYDTLTGGSEHREGRVGQPVSDPLARVFSSTAPVDLAEWPPEFRNDEGDPIVYAAQDFVTIYNDISGEPIFEAGRAGIEVKQRSMAFLGGLNFNTILVFFEITNRSDSLPEGPFTLEETFVAFTSDMDIGIEFTDDIASILDTVEVYGRGPVELNTAIVWDSDFEEPDPWEGKVGFVGVHFLQPPGNPSDGVDNDGDGMIDESPFDGVDNDSDGTIDDIPDEVDTVDESHFTMMASPSVGPPPLDPESDREAYHRMRCLSPEDCAERVEDTDVRFVLSYGSFDLPPGESQIVGIAFVFADPVGDPDHLDVFGDPPRPDPADPVLADFVATILSTKRLYESGFQDEAAPFMIFGTTDLEDTNDPSGPYAVYTNIVDSIPLARTTLHYRTGAEPFQEVPLEYVSGNLYRGEIPGQVFWSDVSYYIEVVDSAYQVLRDPWNAPLETYDFSVLDAPSFDVVACEECNSTVAVAPADYDLDGLLDIFAVKMFPPLLLKNTGDFMFSDVTADAGIEAPSQARGASWGDYDEDGDPDLFIGVYSVTDTHLLYRNEGDGTFAEVSTQAGVRDSITTTSGIWGDVNGDGLLDLLTAQVGTDRLYLNQGDGTFLESSAAWGIEETLSDKAAVFLDMDGDRDADLILIGAAENLVYENIAEEHFLDVTGQSGIPATVWGSVATGDFDNDGDPDLLMSGTALAVYENTTNGHFVEVTESLGLSGISTDDASWADMNSDGLLDIVTSGPTLLVRNPEDTFTDVTSFSGIAEGGGNAGTALALDLDGDGLVDLVQGNVLSNVGYPEGVVRHWAGILLEGTASNRQAVGAKARLFGGELGMSRWVSGGEGKSQEAGLLSFGLGDATTADSLVIAWPSGATQRLFSLAADQVHIVLEDSTLGIGGDEGAGGFPRAWSLAQNFPNPFNPRTTISFAIPGETQAVAVQARLAVFDLRGRLVKVLVEKDLRPGRYSIVWDGREANGGEAPSGIYFYRLKAGTFAETRKMLLMK
jgi:hypothetical protein